MNTKHDEKTLPAAGPVLTGKCGRLPGCRKIRSDSKLNSLPAEQRAMVNKWLFDKGMTYAQVAEACGEMFGLKVSRSSVARYYERVMLAKLVEERASAEAGKPLDPKFEKMDNAERYEWLLNWMVTTATELLRGYEIEPDRKLAKEIVGLVKVAIMGRREKTQRMLVREVERPEFELWAAKECLKEWRRKERNKRREGREKWKETDEDIFGWEDWGHRMERLKNSL